MPPRYFDPDGLARLGSLELVARRVVDGSLTGRHRSPGHGFSVEFLDHRPYVAGDELRALDWKLLGRTDKYYVKRFEDETNLRAYLLVDCSRSMAFSGGGPRKLEYAAYLAAALAHLMLRQGDAVGVVLFDRTVRAELPPRAAPTQFRRVLDLLEDLKPGGETDVGALLHEVADRIPKRGLVVLLSDLIDEVGRLAGGLQHFRHGGHEVIVFQILDQAELTLPFARPARFRDMEGGGRLAADPRALRARYVERVGAFVDAVHAACCERGVGHHLAVTREPYEHFLAAYLERRARGR